MGYYYQTAAKELGPFSVEDEQDPKSNERLAKKLGVKPEHISEARQRELLRPVGFDELAEILGSTIREDKAAKLILFCAGLLTFTLEDQINILMSGESSGGKSYITLEVAAYFPDNIKLIISRASPTAFFHDVGTWDKEAKVLIVDLRQKLLILLDQPHYMLLEMLRSLLSHDRRELLHKITDKSKRGQLRTKNVVILGYPTVIFCAARFTLDEQERTRLFILSPETSQEKIEESLRLAIARIGDRQAFNQWINSHPRRRWLQRRVAEIQRALIWDVVIENQEKIYDRFRSSHPRLAPRHQRDLPRILSLIKAHALLNFCHRERRGDRFIVATREDEEAGFHLYSRIAKPNELGLSPQIYEIYETVIKPLLESNQGVSRKSILANYHQHYGRSLPDEKLRREILPALEVAGLVVQEPDQNDRRRVLVWPPDISPISENAESAGNRGNISGTPLSDRIQVGINWLSDPKNHDNDGWSVLDKLREVVGGQKVVELTLRDNLIMIHPSDPNKVRLVRR